MLDTNFKQTVLLVITQNRFYRPLEDINVGIVAGTCRTRSIFIQNAVDETAADPGFLEGGGVLITIFTSGGGYWRGRASPVTARGAGGAL